ncbi:hypothetical protein ABT294_21035 [Nonomuraea sp. NPDC000554]|uniref:hypothetical protein n=1 Tax=Nonomuraea sp. NPDC000554 TaxID=3154259 RepID=UPI0033337E2E
MLWARGQAAKKSPGNEEWPPNPNSRSGHWEFKKWLRDWRRHKSGGNHGVKTSADLLTLAATTWSGVMPWLFGVLVAFATTGA